MAKKRIKCIHGKYYDTGTSNKSFLQVALDLKENGINNYYFMLEVKNPYIINIDPWNENLTKEEVSAIINECTCNPWYYLREIAQIPEQGGTSIQYKANRGNIAQAWCIFNGVDSWLNIPRQQGKTQSAIAAESWSYSFGTTNSQMIFVNKTGPDAVANLQRLKDQIDLLPSYMKFESIMDDDTGKVVRAVNNATKFKHPITKNEIITKSKATSKESALSIARGLTAPFLHFDEVEFTSRISTIVENSAPTFVTASENAKRNGAVYARVFTSTPGDLGTEAGKDAQTLLDGTGKWTEKMYDMTPEKRAQYIKNNSSNDIIYIEYSYRQLGLSEEWFVKLARKINNPQTVRREVLLQRIQGSTESPFDPDDVEYLYNNIRPVIQEIFLLDTFRLDVYEPLDKSIPYIAGVDCSTGTNGDNNAITLINPYTLIVAAEFKCKYIGETDFIKLMIELIKKHVPRTILVIERNSIGDAIIDFLMQSQISHNLYFDKGRDLLDNNISRNASTESLLKKKAEMKKFYGVYTEGSSRESMIAILLRHMAEFKDKFTTKNVIDDISKLIQKPSGRIEAASGFHDDCIMSYLIALYVYYHGNNLGLFGFVKGSNPIENQNQGIKRIDEVSRDLLPQDVAKAVKQNEIDDEYDYEKVLMKAIVRSQQESIRQVNAGLIQNTSYQQASEDYDSDDTDSISLDFFNELNGF